MITESVSECRRCGREFEEKDLPKYRISASDESYVDHRYCKRCRWEMQRAARACDPRHADVGGHGTLFPESPAIIRNRKGRAATVARRKEVES